MERIIMILKRKEQIKKKQIQTNYQTRGNEAKESGLRNFAHSLLHSSL